MLQYIALPATWVETAIEPLFCEKKHRVACAIIEEELIIRVDFCRHLADHFVKLVQGYRHELEALATAANVALRKVAGFRSSDVYGVGAGSTHSTICIHNYVLFVCLFFDISAL